MENRVMEVKGARRRWAALLGIDFRARLGYTERRRKMEEESMLVHPPRHIVWSTDTVDLSDPFQRKWYIRQVLLHGRTQDIRALDLEEVASLLDDLNLPPDVFRLWKAFLERRSHAQG